MATPRALPAPSQPVVLMTTSLVQQALDVSRVSERKRVILPFHKSPEDPLHRMFNAMQPGTYVQPHRHKTSAKSEVFLVLAGALDFAVFDDDGQLTLVQHLAAGSETFGIDLGPGTFHSFQVRTPDTVIYEVKPGPYVAMDDKDFAPWAPREGEAGVDAYMQQLALAMAAFLAR